MLASCWASFCFVLEKGDSCCCLSLPMLILGSLGFVEGRDAHSTLKRVISRPGISSKYWFGFGACRTFWECHLTSSSSSSYIIIIIIIIINHPSSSSSSTSSSSSSSIIHHPSSIIHHPSSIIHHPSSIIHHPSSIIHHPSSSSIIIHHPSSSSSSSSSHPMKAPVFQLFSFGSCHSCTILEDLKQLLL